MAWRTHVLHVSVFMSSREYGFANTGSPNDICYKANAGLHASKKQSLISAVMEAIETEVAENMGDKFIKFCTWEELNKNQIPYFL